MVARLAMTTAACECFFFTIVPGEAENRNRGQRYNNRCLERDGY